MPVERDPSDDLGRGENRPRPGESIIARLPKKGAARKAVIIIIVFAVIIGTILMVQNGQT